MLFTESCDQSSLSPSALDLFLKGYLLAHPIEGEDVEELVIQERSNGEKIIFEYYKQASMIYARTIHKEKLFIASASQDTQVWLVTQPNGSIIGWLDDNNVTDSVNKITMTVESQPTKQNGGSGHHYKIMKVGENLKTIELLGCISWHPGDLEIDVLSIFMKNRTKCLVLLKAIHLFLTKYADASLRSREKTAYIETFPTSAEPLCYLENIYDVRVVAKGPTGSHTFNFDVVCWDDQNNENRILSMVYCYSTMQLEVKNPYGVVIFRATAIEDFGKALIVTLHGKLSLGYVKKNGEYCDSNSKTVMTVQDSTLPTHFPQKIVYASPCKSNQHILASVTDIEIGKEYRLKFEERLDCKLKALVFAQSFKIAFMRYEFGCTNLPSRCFYNKRYGVGNPAAPATLFMMDHLVNTTLSLICHNSEKGLTYIEVHDDDEADRVVMVFEATHKLGNVHATAKSAKGREQFTAFGLWNMNEDLSVYLNSGTLAGLFRNNHLFTFDMSPAAEIVTETESNESSRMLYKFYDTRKASYQKTVDRANLNLLAEIRSGDYEVFIKFKADHGSVNPELKSMIYSYALRLFYNWRFHIRQLPDMTYEYSD